MVNQLTTVPAGRLLYGVAMLRSRAKGWLQRENVLCSSVMEERVSNFEVLRVATCTLCVVCAVLAAGGSFVAAALFVVAAVASSVAGKGRCGTADGTGKGGEL
ncbi:MAG: hypothetical protein IJ901_10635 [Bacteroidaceae bacterium]|nr:hypothetical protein [Bacteroidaceae bacterium]